MAGLQLDFQFFSKIDIDLSRLIAFKDHLQVHWAKDNLDGYMNFYSCSGDGRVTNWTLVKTSLWFSDLLVVNFTKQLKNFKNEVPMTDGVRTFAFKPDDDSLYLIGTEEGDIHLVTTDYSTAFITTYRSILSLMYSTEYFFTNLGLM